MSKRTKLLLFAGVLLLALAAAGWAVSRRDNSKGDAVHTSTAPSANPTPKTASASDSKDTFDKNKYSLTDPASPWIIVNKRRQLSPVTYAPTLATPSIPLRLDSSVSEMKVSTQMSGALEKLVAGAKAAGISLMLASGYRSYQEQISVYNNEVKNYGQAVADSESARPGFSEHQTGLAADLEPVSRQCEVATCFGDLQEGKWVAEHAYEYGFIVRYPQGSQGVTGYTYEPWHVRYVGTDLANELHDQGNPLLENFFGIDAAPSYQ